MKIYEDLNTPELYELALKNNEGVLGDTGAFLVNTGKYTGRSPDDKYTVYESSSAHSINWGDVNKPFGKEDFFNLKSKMDNYLKNGDIYVQNVLGGKDLNIRVITERAWHSVFARNMFMPYIYHLETLEPELTILHAPGFKASPEEDKTNSEAFIIMNLYEKLIIIGGTEYAGEIKKSAFCFMNYKYPLAGTLTMHASANRDAEGNGAVFFGLSGTGKTTLSADPNRFLVGDDEHGWDDNGVFNLEGGCYAKIINLKKEEEPLIHSAINKFGAIQENVWVEAETRSSVLSNSTKTENTRSSYPLSHIPNSIPSRDMGHPTDIIMLTCDSFGVLPPISKLTPKQAMYYFLSGYTAKVAGTETGVMRPEAVFSSCFGEPFMVLDPRVYGELLRKKIEEHEIRCWSINTGWTGGGYNSGGERISIAHTRLLLDAALSGDLDDVPMIEHDIFRVMIPTMCKGVPNEMLDPVKTWENKEDYLAIANQLYLAFEENYKKFNIEITT